MSVTPEDFADEEGPVGVSLEEVLIDDALRTRAPRAPDPEAEATGFAAVASALRLDAPAAFGSITECALSLLGLEGVGTSGVSVLETGHVEGKRREGAAADSEERDRFRWIALAGEMARRSGDTIPADFSPCGACLAEKRALLFHRPERRFRYLLDDVPVLEALVVPLAAGPEGAGGTLWAATHSGGRRFDREDLRVMTVLAALAGLVHRAEAARGALARAERVKDDFLAEISHDLRTPLNAIGGYAALLEMEISGPLTEAQAAHVEGILQNQARLASLVTEILDATSRGG